MVIYKTDGVHKVYHMKPENKNTKSSSEEAWRLRRKGYVEQMELKTERDIGGESDDWQTPAYTARPRIWN